MSCDNLDVYNVRHLILAHLSGQVPLICCSEKFDFRLKHAGGGGGWVFGHDLCGPDHFELQIHSVFEGHLVGKE